jgi:hypothetical protein
VQGVVYDWNARNLETQQPEEPPAGLWSSVLDALHLDADTQRDALQCFELFGTPLTRLLEERLQLTQRYHQLMTPGGAAANPGAAADSSSSASDGSSAVVHVTSAMTFEAVAETLISSAAVLRALAANLERYQVRVMCLSRLFPAHTLPALLHPGRHILPCYLFDRRARQQTAHIPVTPVGASPAPCCAQHLLQPAQDPSARLCL